MPFTEVQRRGGKEYLYRVRSIRKGSTVRKQRIFLGEAGKLNGRARKQKERAADERLDGLHGLLKPEEVAFLDQLRRQHRVQPKGTSDNRYEAFVAQFTFDSNAIEGNTLTLGETSQLLFDGLVPARTLREVNETLNHKRAFDHVLAYDGRLDSRFICELHRHVVQNTLRPGLADQAGRYRTLPVFIRGVEWTPPDPLDVPRDMRTLLAWHTRNRPRLHPVVLASYVHVAFEMIHPFVDGNGRVGRLLMNWMLRRDGFPMVNIPSRGKREYYRALHAGQVDGNLRPFVALLLALYRRQRLRF